MSRDVQVRGGRAEWRQLRLPAAFHQARRHPRQRQANERTPLGKRAVNLCVRCFSRVVMCSTNLTAMLPSSMFLSVFSVSKHPRNMPFYRTVLFNIPEVY